MSRSGNPEAAAEATLDGWDADDSCYQFQYRTPAEKNLVVKCLPLGESILVHWSSGEDGADIKSIDVDLAKFTSEAGSSVADGYKDLDGFFALIAPGLHAELQVGAPHALLALDLTPPAGSSITSDACDRGTNMTLAHAVRCALEQAGSSLLLSAQAPPRCSAPEMHGQAMCTSTPRTPWVESTKLQGMGPSSPGCWGRTSEVVMHAAIASATPAHQHLEAE